MYIYICIYIYILDHVGVVSISQMYECMYEYGIVWCGVVWCDMLG